MGYTLAQHVRYSRRVRTIERTLHVGILVVAGSPMRGVNRDQRPALGPSQLDVALRVISREAHRVYRPFQWHDSRWTLSYSFVFEIVRTTSTVPVHTDFYNAAPPGLVGDGSLWTGGRALLEARTRRLENIAIIVDVVAGSPHGPLLDDSGLLRPVGFGRVPGLQAHCSNAMLLGLESDLTGTLTAAHEIGHMLGMGNAREAGSIMGPRSQHRSLTVVDRQLIHSAIENGVTGIRRPSQYETAGSMPPYVFPGAVL